MPRVLIPGGKGQVGTFAAHHASAFGFEMYAPDLGEIDITDPASVAAIFSDFNPDIVINCAAYTAVDKAENEPELAHAINVTGPVCLAKQCAPDIPLLHISTDYVFNGEAATPYTETMTPTPLNVYGKTKLEGEKQLREAHRRNIILRTAWVYSHSHSNFLKTMLRLGRERDTLNVVNDQHGSPTHAEDIAVSLLKMAQKICAGSFNEHGYGIYHYTGGGDTTWFGFAQAIFDEFSANTGKPVDLRSIRTSEFPTPAKRAAYSILDNTKIQNVFGIEPVAWEERVRSTVRQALEQESETS